MCLIDHEIIFLICPAVTFGSVSSCHVQLGNPGRRNWLIMAEEDRGRYSKVTRAISVRRIKLLEQPGFYCRARRSNIKQQLLGADNILQRFTRGGTLVFINVFEKFKPTPSSFEAPYRCTRCQERTHSAPTDCLSYSITKKCRARTANPVATLPTSNRSNNSNFCLWELINSLWLFIYPEKESPQNLFSTCRMR